MWLRRAIALCALAIVTLVVVLVIRHPGGSSPASAPTATPTASATPHKPRASKPRAIAEISGAKARRAAVPILMYHVISRAPAGVANAELWVDQGVFAQEMQALKAKGYTAVTLQQAWDGWKHGGPLPRKPVVVSFDDGYLSHYTHAKPVLRKLDWPGVLFLTIHNIGAGGLTEHQVRSLLHAGWEIDSHTLTHPDLPSLDDTALQHELVDSRAQLQQRFGVKADFFAYPAGRYDARVESATKAAGYTAATTVEPGIASRHDDPFALHRVRVNASDTSATLLARLAGG